METYFVAYSSHLAAQAETIEKAVSEINQGGTAYLLSWRETNRVGHFVIGDICRAIDAADGLVCDLTGLNHNVLFEFGYALAKAKKVWPLIDPSIDNAVAEVERLGLKDLLQVRYSNHREIVAQFYADAPYERGADPELITLFGGPGADGTHLLYVVSPVQSDASIELQREIAALSLPVRRDDPYEDRGSTLTSYGEYLRNAFAVVTHSVSDKQSRFVLHNAKCAFVAGLAHGAARDTLMLAQDPFSSAPVDYASLMKAHATAEEAGRYFRPWLQQCAERYEALTATQTERTRYQRARTELARLDIGDPVAEYEEERLDQYFVYTASFGQAMTSEGPVLLVGRKGSGKTANLLMLEQHLGRSLANHVCVIRPVAYHMEGLLDIVQGFSEKANRGYLIEAFWKFLLYTELARSVALKIEQRLPQIGATEDERPLLELVEQHEDLIRPEFSFRLDNAVRSLAGLGDGSAGREQRTGIAQVLHEGLIERLRAALGAALHRKTKVVVLVDNLDKAWRAGDRLALTSDVLFGLLRSRHVIYTDFRRSDSRRQSINLSLLIFLRSDIFGHIYDEAREPDKLPVSWIRWDDPQELLAVVEQRFWAASDQVAAPEQVWDQYFCASVDGIPTREYIIEHAMPRPRDVVYLVRQALNKAIGRGHTVIEEGDLRQARDIYSRWALSALPHENGIRVDQLEALLYEFVGQPAIVTDADITRLLQAANTQGAEPQRIIEHLCQLGFLGPETSDGQFDFIECDDDTVKLYKMRDNLLQARERERGNAEAVACRYMINKPFWAELEITPPGAH